MFCSNDVSKEERPELVKKVYKWNTKEEAKQAFKELLKEKVVFLSLSPPVVKREVLIFRLGLSKFSVF